MARSRADSAAEASSSGAVADGSVSHPHHHGPLRVELAAAGDGAAEGVAAAADEAAAEEAAAAAAASTSASSTGLLAEPLSTVRMGPVLTTTFNSVVIAGLELGLLNFLGTALQVEGLHSVSATRAGFLAEVTAVLTPLVSYAAGYTIPPQMWAAVAVGLVGSTMVAYDASQGGSEGSQAAPVAAPAAAAAAPAVADSASTAAATGVAATAAASTAADAASSLSAAAPVDPVTSLAAAAAAVAETAAGAPTGIEVGPPSLELTAANAANAVAAAAAAAPSASDAASLAASLEPAGPALSDAAAALSDAAADAAASVAGAAGAALEAASSAASSAATEAAVAAVSNAAAAATAAAEPLAITGGETYLLLACLFFSICTVRMGIYSPRMDTVQLAAMKKVGLSSMSVMWMATASLQGGAALSSALAFPDLSDRAPLSIAVLLYSGLGPGALATYLQVEGLSTVPATTAQVIYSFTPLATAFFAHTFLGGEATGPVAWVGGCLLIAAALMAARAQYVQAKEQQAAAATAAAAAAAAGPSASNGSGSGTQ
ncbi:hypothetical protein HYH03_015885 [Edaphochlamys debaryana]|uniref:EamA domain-containing protein n=1 Tax=Edaphochlamys debaryana TaxID=47281 RepID=A0A835XKZ1_9CHLO|nr:hypothetical protein HYH03_015885 [Edaphochlamys debaryana]|eukprot:KAG2485399.1 hypothetical protein HYH03_015885 [Edaphochlamys debaryana]